MEVKDGRVSILAALVREANPNVCLEGFLVGREAGIPVDAEERASRRSGIGHEMRAEASERSGEAANEPQCGFDHDLLIKFFVLGEPLAVIVASQLTQEVEQLRTEHRVFGHLLNNNEHMSRQR
jgi:hypothetical protein